MKKTVFGLMMLAASCAFAVDGVVLINDATAKATGGYPFRITQSGSYRLSGNLAPQLNQAAIQITANNVLLDLNGFNVQCLIDETLFSFGCITDGGRGAGVHNVTIRNGTVLTIQSGPGNA